MIEIPFKSSVVNSLEHVVFFTIIFQMVKHIGFTNISELNVFFWVYKYLSMVGNMNTTKLHDLKSDCFKITLHPPRYKHCWVNYFSLAHWCLLFLVLTEISFSLPLFWFSVVIPLPLGWLSATCAYLAPLLSSGNILLSWPSCILAQGLPVTGHHLPISVTGLD